MINLRYVFKIRTFKKEHEGRWAYTIVFEGDVNGSNGTVTWQYPSKQEAEVTILRVVANAEGIEWIDGTAERLKSSQLYIDLMRGFDGGKPTRSK